MKCEQNLCFMKYDNMLTHEVLGKEKTSVVYVIY